MSTEEVVIEQAEQHSTLAKERERLASGAAAYDKEVDRLFRAEGLVIEDYQRPANYPPRAGEPKRRVTTEEHSLGAGKHKSKPAAARRYVPQAELDAEFAALEKLSKAVVSGDPTAIDKLRAKLDNCPHIWWRLADLQKMVEEAMAEQLAAEDPLLLESFRKRASELRDQLQGGTQSPLVMMLVSQFVACWVFVQFVELRVLRSKDMREAAKSLLPAQRRLESATRSLALATRMEFLTTSRVK